MRLFFATILLGLAVLFGLSMLYANVTAGELTSVVTHKERVCSKANEDCKWMILTEDMSFENRDSLVHLKFNSTDIQGKAVVGQTFKFQYYGLRIPLFSTYPNIIDLQKVD